MPTVSAKLVSHKDVDSTEDTEVEITLRNEEPIGKGAFGQVFRVDMISPQTCTVAVKRIRHNQHKYKPSPRSILQMKERQIDLYRRIEHPCIIRLLYYYPNILESEICWNLVLEYMPTTAYEHWKQLIDKEQLPSVKTIKIWMCQLFGALNYLHSLTICHRDCKPENLLVDPTIDRLKLGDFGSAKMLTAEKEHSTYQVTRYYRAPELLLGNSQYSVSVDVWASGCILYELLTGKVLWPGRCTREQLQLVTQLMGTPTESELKEIMPADDQRTVQSKAPPTFEPGIKAIPWIEKMRRTANDTEESCSDLIGRILTYAPSNRLSAAGCLQHDFLRCVQTADGDGVMLRDGTVVSLRC